MKTHEFFTLLEHYKDKALVFEYEPNAFVGANYHITEIKHVVIDTVDCGSQTDNWNETLIQLWESPNEKDKTAFMTVFKALGILKKVGKIKSYDFDAELKFEYSNEHFHTAQLFVNDFELKGNQLILKLAIKKTDCKAKTVCGVQDVEKQVEVTTEPCCAPDGNCC